MREPLSLPVWLQVSLILWLSHTAALESRTSESQQAPGPVPESVLPDPAPVPAAGLSPPSEATCTTQQGSGAPSGEVPGGASTAAVGASDGASSAGPAGASSGASVTAASGAPDGPRPKEPPRVPREVPARGSGGAPGNGEAPGATNSHSGLSSGTEKASGGRHPTVAPALATGRGAAEDLMVKRRPA